MASVLCALALAGCGVAADPGVRVWGYVLDKDGLIVSNATVTLYVDNTVLDTKSNPARTSTTGLYQFDGIAPGNYNLWVTKNYYSASATLMVRGNDYVLNLTLPASGAALAEPAAVPGVTATPTVTPTPTAPPLAPTPTPGPMPTPTPGFELLLALSGMGITLAAKKLE